MKSTAINPDAWAGLPLWAQAAYIKSAPLIEFSSAHPVIQAVSRATGLTVSEIISESRLDNVVTARMICVYVIRQRGYSLQKLGMLFGGRDHATMLHSCRMAQQRIGNPSYQGYTQLYEQVKHLV